jgi:hypothetical protein
VLRGWARRFRGVFAGEAAERCVLLLDGSTCVVRRWAAGRDTERRIGRRRARSRSSRRRSPSRSRPVVRQRARGSRRRRARTCRSARGGSSNLLPDVWTRAHQVNLQVQDRCVRKWSCNSLVLVYTDLRFRSVPQIIKSRPGRPTSPLALPHRFEMLLNSAAPSAIPCTRVCKASRHVYVLATTMIINDSSSRSRIHQDCMQRYCTSQNVSSVSALKPEADRTQTVSPR